MNANEVKVSNGPCLMLCSFMNQLLAQLDLLRYWKETQPTRTISTSCRNSSMNVNDISPSCTRCKSHCPSS